MWAIQSSCDLQIVFNCIVGRVAISSGWKHEQGCLSKCSSHGSRDDVQKILSHLISDFWENNS